GEMRLRKACTGAIRPGEAGMARKSVFSSQYWIWLSLLMALSAGIAVCTWQSEVQSRRERNWTLKTSGVMAPLVVKNAPVVRDEPSENQRSATSDSDLPLVDVAAEAPVTTKVANIEVAQPLAPTQQPLLPPIAGEGEKEPALA